MMERNTLVTASILDGKALAESLRGRYRDEASSLIARGVQPGLAVILVGEDPASQVYVRNKINACLAAGIRSDHVRLPAGAETAQVIAEIDRLNRDPAIHGILVQLPLPRQIDEAAVLAAVSVDKDVDGFDVANVGALAQGAPRFVPCTPKGVMELLAHAGVDLDGAEAVVVGRSNIVGKPMAQLLLAANATVTVCHSRTRDLAFHTRRADVLVAAIGRPKMISGDMIKPGAVVVDVGINRLADGKLCGDVDFETARTVASWITPVPGGVGPMTIAMLLANTLDAARRSLDR